MRSWTSVSVVLLTGCTLLTSFDGLSSGSASESADGGPTTASSSGSVDAGPGDAQPKPPPPSTDAGFSCAGVDAAFCTDFQNIALDGVGDLHDVSPSSTAVIEGGVLRVSMPRHDDADEYNAEVGRQFEGDGRIATIEVDVRLSDTDWTGLGGSARIVTISLSGSKFVSAELYIGQAYTNLTINNSGQLLYTKPTAPLPRDRWVRLRFACDFTPGNGAMRLFYDATLAAERKNISFPPVTGAALQLWLGIARPNAPTPPIEVRYDNLLVSYP